VQAVTLGDQAKKTAPYDTGQRNEANQDLLLINWQQLKPQRPREKDGSEPWNFPLLVSIRHTPFLGQAYVVDLVFSFKV